MLKKIMSTSVSVVCVDGLMSSYSFLDFSLTSWRPEQDVSVLNSFIHSFVLQLVVISEVNW